MVFKNGELLRTYYMVRNFNANEDSWRFSDMIDKNGLTPDQLGDVIYEFKEISIHFTDEQTAQSTTFTMTKEPGPGAAWDVIEWQGYTGAVENYGLSKNNVRSWIDTTPSPNAVLPSTVLAIRKEDWLFTFENHVGDYAYITLVVRSH